MTNLEVKRFELKYLIHRFEYHALVERLKYALNADKHSTPHHGYFVRSLYFDSHRNECYYDKLAGIKTREKYRLRIYHPDSPQVKFEIKNKWNNQVFKETASIDRETAGKVIRGDYHALLPYNNPVLNKIYIVFTQKGYRPRVIVDYHRDAFVYFHFNTRITIDKHLRSTTTDFDIFSRDLHTVPVILEAKDILEIKYDSLLPDFIRGLIQPAAVERMALSKYSLSRRHAMPHL